MQKDLTLIQEQKLREALRLIVLVTGDARALPDTTDRTALDQAALLIGEVLGDAPSDPSEVPALPINGTHVGPVKPAPNLTEPTVGRIVHYVSFGTPNGEFAPAHRAAVVTQVHETSAGMAKLCILNPTGLFFSDWLPLDPSGRGSGTWHWPERV